MLDELVGWLVGWLAGWLVGWWVCRTEACFEVRPSRPAVPEPFLVQKSIQICICARAFVAVGWLVGWLVGLLVGL